MKAIEKVEADTILKNVGYGLHSVSITDILENLDIQLLVDRCQHDSRVISKCVVNDILLDRFNTNKAIIVNGGFSEEIRKYAIAYELGLMILDYGLSNINDYYHISKVNNIDKTRKDVIRFIYNLLLPEDVIMDIYNFDKSHGVYRMRTIEGIASLMKVNKEIVASRLQELEGNN